MTKDEAAAALAHCAVFDFEKKSHHMVREFSNGNRLVVYKLEPLSAVSEYAVVMQYFQPHLPDPTKTKAEFYASFDRFKTELAGVVDSETQLKSHKEK